MDPFVLIKSDLPPSQNIASNLIGREPEPEPEPEPAPLQLQVMASSSLVLPTGSLKTLVLSKIRRNPYLSFVSSTVSFKTQNNAISSISSSFSDTTYGCLSSRFIRKVAVSSEYDPDDEEEEEDERDVRGHRDLKIFVGNLPFNVDSAQIAELFEEAGIVETAEVIYDKLTGRSRGFGFVTMSSEKDVKAAVEQFNGYELEGRPMRVNSGPPPPKEDFPSRPRFGAGGHSSDSSNRVYVGNLSWGVDDLALETLFSDHGRVLEAKVIYDRETGRSRGFGFVIYGSAEEVNSAISGLDGADLNGRPLRVSVAESKPRRQF